MLHVRNIQKTSLSPPVSLLDCPCFCRSTPDRRRVYVHLNPGKERVGSPSGLAAMSLSCLRACLDFHQVSDKEGNIAFFRPYIILFYGRFLRDEETGGLPLLYLRLVPADPHWFFLFFLSFFFSSRIRRHLSSSLEISVFLQCMRTGSNVISRDFP